MDFFEHQAAARKTSTRLVVLFGLALLGLTAGVYGLFSVLDMFNVRTAGVDSGVRFAAFDPLRLVLALALTGAFVGGGSAIRTYQLRGGGRVVAESMGARLISNAPRDAAEQRALNVVEEMAIASGSPVPPVYLLDKEDGINAFAAGYGPNDAVIGLTRGALESFSRQELQGVVGHEFSHILNGDMRLNLRLIGYLHGILLMTLFGRMLFYLGAHSPRIGRGRGGGSDKGAAPAFALGLGLLALGSIGHLFARLIQSAISRQREYLADASAVQFTRSVDGIAGALERLGGHAAGSRLYAPNAEEAAHMMFGSTGKWNLASFFSTHPPLDKRVARLRGLSKEQLARMGALKRSTRTSESGPGLALGLAGGESGMGWSDPEVVGLAAGSLTDEDVDYARDLLERIPPALRAAVVEPFEARAVIYALLLSGDPGLRREELVRLEAHADGRTYTATARLAPLTEALDPRLRLPLLELAARPLREMSARQYQAFRANLEMLVMSDQRVTPFEHALRGVILCQLDPLFGGRDLRRLGRLRLRDRLEEVGVVLSMVAHGAGRADRALDTAWGAGRQHLPPGLPVQPLDLRDADAAFERSLGRLWDLRPAELRLLLEALWLAAVSDGEVRVVEAELFRAVAAALACPMPPLLAGQPVEAGVLPAV